MERPTIHSVHECGRGSLGIYGGLMQNDNGRLHTGSGPGQGGQDGANEWMTMAEA